MNAQNALEILIKTALGESKEIKLGGVDFWFEGDIMFYSKPTSAWDLTAVNRYLVNALTALSSK